LDEPALLIDLENVGPYGEITSPATVDAIGSSRVRFQQDQLITTQLRPYLLKVTAPPANAIGSPEWISLRLNEDLIRPRFLFYLLTTARYSSLATTLSSGKQHPRISADTLRAIEIPSLSLREQDELIAELDPLLAESFELLNGLEGIRGVIDRVFLAEFGLDPGDLTRLPADRSFAVRLADVAANRDARFSYKYHSPSVKRAIERLSALPHRPLREVLAEPACLGDSVSPDDYRQGTGRYYVSMVALKRWSFEVDGLAEVSDDYYDQHTLKHVEPDDILMARSGEGTIGKVALVPEGVSGVCADFVIRMRPNRSEIRPGFLRYCLTSSFYQHVIYGEKKGLGNNTNIFPNQLHEFPLISVSLEDQERICRELDAALLASEQALAAAKTLRSDIQDILENALTV
jgi:type I restriction enzyme S subunit